MYLATKGIHPPVKQSIFTMDVGCVRLFKVLLDEANAKFVISSSWRKDTVAQSTRVFKALAWCGFTDAKKYCVGVTPRQSCGRGGEIDHFIKANNVTNFVILDDDVFDIHQKDQLVRTDHEVGLTVKNMLAALKILELNYDYAV